MLRNHDDTTRKDRISVFCTYTVYCYGSASHNIDRILKKLAYKDTILGKTNCLDLFAHIRIALTNLGHLVCTTSHMNVVCYTNFEKAEREKSVVSKHSWTNAHRITWNEASTLAIESDKFSRMQNERID